MNYTTDNHIHHMYEKIDLSCYIYLTISGYWHKKRYADQFIEEADKNPHAYSQLIYFITKREIHTGRKRQYLQQILLVKLIVTYRRMYISL